MPVLEGAFKHILLIKEVRTGCILLFSHSEYSVVVCEFSTVLDILDQGWIVLRYPYGDYFSGCKDYAVTEILFTCDHSDQLVSISTYSLNF